MQDLRVNAREFSLSVMLCGVRVLYVGEILGSLTCELPKCARLIGRRTCSST